MFEGVIAWAVKSIIDVNLSTPNILESIIASPSSLVKVNAEPENIPEGKKSIAVNVTIQSEEKTLNENDLENINKLIISSVESKSGAKIRS